jgi:RNA polymerase sigma-70 factor (ECF subfamily)
MKYLKQDEKAKDAVMEIFESMDKKLVRFEVKNFRAWIYTVSRNYCLMELRKKKREIEPDQVNLSAVPDVENSIILHPDNEEDAEKHNVDEFLDQLKDCQRRCLEMMYFQNMSYKAIAAETGYSLKQVKSYIQNGKRKLKQLLKEGR